MSFSDNVVKNPASKFVEFKSADKQFVYYDKEKKENVAIPLPIDVIVLDELSTITGYSDDYRCSFYSNEVHSTVKEPLVVKTFKGGFREEGLYNDIKGNVKAAGGKFAKSLYCMVIGDDYDLINIKLTGAAMSEWIDAKLNTRSNVIRISNTFKEGKKGATVYNVPVFETSEITDDVKKAAIELDTLLQEYFKSRNTDQDVQQD